MARRFLVIAAVLGFLGVAAGAFGAHMLEKRLDPHRLEQFNTGVQYHMMHVLALPAVALVAWRRPEGTAAVAIAGWAFILGIVLFSGSLYALALTGARIFIWTTPIGGVSFLVGWAALTVAAAGLREP